MSAKRIKMFTPAIDSTAVCDMVLKAVIGLVRAMLNKYSVSHKGV